MENQPEYVSSNFHRLRVTKGDERARKRYVKIIHRSRRDIFSGVNIFKIREKNDCYVMKIDNGRSKIYGAGISRHCSSVRFSGIRTERGGKEERGETKLMQRDCEGIYIYIAGIADLPRLCETSENISRSSRAKEISAGR